MGRPGSDAATALRVRLFGGIAVDGLPANRIGTRKARSLLAVLASARGRPVGVDRLCSVLWPDELPSRPADQLGVLISRLRSVLGAHRIRHTTDGYLLHVDWLDLIEFDRRADDADAALREGAAARAVTAARAALDLAADEPLIGETGRWADDERRTTHRRRARTRLVLAEAALLSGQPGMAVGAAEEAIDDDPYDEAAARILMRAQAAMGRPAVALAAYAALRDRLGEDLGTDPAEETTALHTRILRGQVARSPSGGHQIPVGRDRPLERLNATLDEAVDGGVRVVALRGEPGIGKTTVLEAFLGEARDRACVLHGRCDALGRDLPLQPLLDGLDGLLWAMPAERAAEVLGSDAPTVQPLLGHAPVTGSAPVPVPTDPGEAQARLFAGLLRVVRRAAGAGPLVVAVDDLHLAGPSTVEWLRFAVRRAVGLMVVVTARPGRLAVPDNTEQLDLGPLDLTAATELVGSERAMVLWQRSDGNPLLLLALAASAGEATQTLRETVEPTIGGLGGAERTVRAAAVLGPRIDPELLAGVLDLPVTDVLDDLDIALRAGLLRDGPSGLTFRHELVREVTAGTVNVARRSFLHRRAAAALAGRARRDPLAVAWHARHGGDASLASAELVRASELAARRGDLPVAAGLADEAIALDPSPRAYLARTDVLMRRGDFAAAESAADLALEAGAGAAGYELAGWIAYYQRRYARALHLARQGAAQVDDAAAQSTCRALAGRIQHSRGDLKAADAELRRALAVDGGEGMPRVWLAALRVHQGRAEPALELVETALAEPGSIRHPFAVGHGHFARWYALGMLGRADEALAALDAYERAYAGSGVMWDRMAPAAHNMRAWLLRGIGRLDAADELNRASMELTNFPGMAEPRAHARLDLVEGALLEWDLDRAAERLAEERLSLDDSATMSWHQRERHGLLSARIALGQHRWTDAEQAAVSVAGTAGARGALRHEIFGRVVQACARAGAAAPADPDGVQRILAALPSRAGLEAWRWTAMAARHLDVPAWWDDAQRQVTQLAGRAGEHADAFLRFADRWLEHAGRG